MERKEFSNPPTRETLYIRPEPKTSQTKIVWPTLSSIRPFLSSFIQPLNRTHAVVFAVGLLIGLVVLGWWVWPVQWTDATPAHMTPRYQQTYIEMVADLYAYDLDAARVAARLKGWDDDATFVCQVVAHATDPATRMRLIAIAATRNGIGCP